MVWTSEETAKQNMQINEWLLSVYEGVLALAQKSDAPTFPWKDILAVVKNVFPTDLGREKMYAEYLDSRGFVVRVRRFERDDLNRMFYDSTKPDDLCKISKSRLTKEIESLKFEMEELGGM